MRKIIYLICSFFAVFFVSCESNEPGSESPTYKPFSVSNTKTVIFSPGNLQYHPVNNEWRFAPSQLDYIGYENKNISSTYNGWIDLFGWGTGNNPTNNSDKNKDYSTFVDWGTNKIGNYAPNTWRTLTKDEWSYLCLERPNYDKLIGVGKVNGVIGLILLPDKWTCPSGISFNSGFNDDSGTEYFKEYNNFNMSDWIKLEASGAVFLPAAGIRYGNNVSTVQYYGFYYSSDAENDIYPYYLNFSQLEAYIDFSGRFYAYSVRLVRD